MHRRNCLLTLGLGLGLSLDRMQAAAAQASSASTASPPGQDARLDLLRLIDRPRVPLAPDVTSLPRSGPFERQHFSFAADATERVPGIAVTRSPVAGRRPAVIVLHGTGDRKEGMVPLLEVLADRGFVAVAIDGRYHGERAKGPEAYVSAILRAYRTGAGHPLLYDTVWDVMRLVDYLGTRPEIDPARIGLVGISKGGMETYLTAAVDPRVAVAVPVIAVQSFAWALDHDAWQARVETFQEAVDAAARENGLGRPSTGLVRSFYDRVVPGIYTEFDGPAMLPHIAPRPLLVINGDSDARTPLPGVQAAAAAAERAYRSLRVPEKFRLLIQADTGHEFTPMAQLATIDWLVRWLRP